MQILKAGMRALAVTLAIGVLAVLVGGSASAQTPSWTGCSVRLAGGGSGAFTRLSAEAGEIDAAGARGWIVRAGGGCDVHWLATGLVAGVGADYAWQGTEFSVGPGFEARLGDSWDAYGRLGFVRGKTLLYALGGYVETKWSTSEPSLPTPTFKGWLAGGGIETKLADGWSLGGEYRYHRYDTVRVGDVDLDTEQHTVMVTLTLSFGASR
jgi:opacity protein-like surface antigen